MSYHRWAWRCCRFFAEGFGSTWTSSYGNPFNSLMWGTVHGWFYNIVTEYRL